jgi:hypothetical protein
MSTEVAAPLAPLAPVEEETLVVEEQPTAAAVDATKDEVSNNALCYGSTGWPLSDVDFGTSWMIPRLEGLDSQLLTALVLYNNQATTTEDAVAPSVSEEETSPAGEPSMENAEVSTEEVTPEAAVEEETAVVPESKKRSAEDADVADYEEMVSYGKRWCTSALFGVM